MCQNFLSNYYHNFRCLKFNLCSVCHMVGLNFQQLSLTSTISKMMTFFVFVFTMFTSYWWSLVVMLVLEFETQFKNFITVYTWVIFALLYLEKISLCFEFTEMQLVELIKRIVLFWIHPLLNFNTDTEGERVYYKTWANNILLCFSLCISLPCILWMVYISNLLTYQYLIYLCHYISVILKL